MTVLRTTKALIQILLILSISIITSLTISSFTVTAVDVAGCCQQTLRGESCVQTTADNCANGFQEGTSCEESSTCQTGCCVLQGQCSNIVSQETCTAQGGDFFTNSCSEITSCNKGCCQIGNNYLLATSLQCNTLSKQNNLEEITFLPDVTDELSCTQQSQNQNEGCCVDPTGVCSYTTREQCPEGIFEQQTCSSISICQCEPKAYTACVDEDVYWFDSCGNKESIAEDCDYASGTLCTENNGEAYCGSVNCEVTLDKKTLLGDDISELDGVPRQNGESWCEYDGAVGVGNDLVGSRHYRHICINGQEIVEPCRDYREEFCLQTEVIVPGSEPQLQASCVANVWDECSTTCNSAASATGQDDYDAAKRADYQCCTDPQKRCFWNAANPEDITDIVDNINESTASRVPNPELEGVCMPLVPPGLAHWGEDDDGTSQASADPQEVCAQGNTKCTVYFSKDTFSGFDWEIVGNEHCLEEDFAVSAMSYCRSLGDCGAYYNIAGEFTEDGYGCSTGDGTCKGSKHGFDYDFTNINWEQHIGGIKSFSTAGKGLFAGTVDLSIHEGFQTIPSEILVAGAPGLIAVVVSTYFYGFTTTVVGGVTTATSVGASLGAEVLGLTGGLANALGAVAGALVALAWAGAALAVIFIALSFLAETDTLEVEVLCQPWQAPTGGESCELCRDPEVYETLGYDTCSEYRCKSLGSTCQYLQENEGSPRSPCVESNINDVAAPLITPNEEALTQGFRINTFQNGYEIVPAVPAYQPFTFGVLTSEPARCRFAETPIQDFENMTNDFGEPYFSEIHELTITPTPSQENNFYLKCEDINGNHNEADYLIKLTGSNEPDLTPPSIIGSNPLSGSILPVGKHQISIDLTEPATCKYATTNIPVTQMTQSFNCGQASSTLSPLARYSCSTQLSITEGSNTYYIGCQDTAGNINTEPLTLVYEGAPPLTIESISPNGTVDTNKLTITATTRGGSNNGIADCEYRIAGITKPFNETGSTTHTATLPQLRKGNYQLGVTCTDTALSTTKNVPLIINIDDTPPSINHFYTEGNSLVIVTDEEALCEHSSASFTYGEGIAFENTQATKHYVIIEQERYHIICGDEFTSVNEEVIIIP